LLKAQPDKITTANIVTALKKFMLSISNITDIPPHSKDPSLYFFFDHQQAILPIIKIFSLSRSTITDISYI